MKLTTDLCEVQKLSMIAATAPLPKYAPYSMHRNNVTSVMDRETSLRW